eukprot:UN01496
MQRGRPPMGNNNTRCYNQIPDYNGGLSMRGKKYNSNVNQSKRLANQSNRKQNKVYPGRQTRSAERCVKRPPTRQTRSAERRIQRPKTYNFGNRNTIDLTQNTPKNVEKSIPIHNNFNKT